MIKKWTQKRPKRHPKNDAKNDAKTVPKRPPKSEVGGEGGSPYKYIIYMYMYLVLLVALRSSPSERPWTHSTCAAGSTSLARQPAARLINVPFFFFLCTYYLYTCKNEGVEKNNRNISKYIYKGRCFVVLFCAPFIDVCAEHSRSTHDSHF